ncbi:MAG: MBG domain-containing protein, partial [Clostridia bacterium]
MAEKNKKSSKVDKTKEQKEFVPLKVDDSASRTESNVKVNDKRQSSTVNSSTGAVAKTEVEDGSWKVFLFFVIATLLIIVALAIIGSDKGNGKVLGKLIVEDEVRYGRSTDIVLELDEEIKIEENTPISWLMDNVEVKRENYVDGKGTKLSVMPSRTGNHKVTVKIGKNHYNEINIDVLKPKLSLCAQDTTIVYGDELPEFTYTIKGLVDNETMEQLGYDGKV